MEAVLKENIGFQRTKLGLIPCDWSLDDLGNIAEIKMGQSPSSSSYNSEGIGKYLIQGNADIKDRK